MFRLKLYEGPKKIPELFDWRAWELLPADDPRYREFRTVLEAIYDPESPHSMLFRNTAPELTDVTNNIVGLDRKYLYIYDHRPGRFRLREKSPGRFVYADESLAGKEPRGLFELEVSEEQPLYAIPISVKKIHCDSVEMERFVKMLDDAENINEAYIAHSDRTRFPRLMFPGYGISMALDSEELRKIGVRKIVRY